MLDKLSELGYITYELNSENKKLTYQITDWVVKCSGEECMNGNVYTTDGYGFLCLPRNITERLVSLPSHEETVRILEEIRICSKNTHKQCSDHEHINKLICWYSKNICPAKADEPQNNRVAESAYILRAYISPCRNCDICEYDCERILDLSVPVIETNNIRGPCLPVDLTKFEKEFFGYE